MRSKRKGIIVSPSFSKEGLTIKELIKGLQKCPENANVKLIHDVGIIPLQWIMCYVRGEEMFYIDIKTTGYFGVSKK